MVSFHYKLAEVAPDGSHGDWMEESSGGEPLFYLHGFHNVVVGLERALEGKAVGKSIEITLKPEEAYGPRQPDAVQRVPIKHLQLQQGVSQAEIRHGGGGKDRAWSTQCGSVESR